MSGVSPVARYEVAVPGTEPVTLPFRRMRYCVGRGPLEGADQKIAAEVSVARPAVSRVGRATGGPAAECHLAQIAALAAIKTMAATPLTATTQLRRLERCLAVAPRAAADEARTAAGPARGAARPGAARAGKAWAPGLCGTPCAGTADAGQGTSKAGRSAGLGTFRA